MAVYDPYRTLIKSGRNDFVKTMFEYCLRRYSDEFQTMRTPESLNQRSRYGLYLPNCDQSRLIVINYEQLKDQREIPRRSGITVKKLTIPNACSQKTVRTLREFNAVVSISSTSERLNRKTLQDLIAITGLTLDIDLPTEILDMFDYTELMRRIESEPENWRDILRST
jgi:hypothetical protein